MNEALIGVFGISISYAAKAYITFHLIDVSYVASIWLTVFIALYRYLAICKPFTNSFRHVENHGQKYAVLILVISICYHLIYICLNISSYQGSLMDALNISVLFALPLIILTFLTGNLVSAIRKRDKVRRRIHQNETPQDNSIIVTLTTIVITFLICHVPVAIVRMWVILAEFGYITWGFPTSWFVGIAFLLLLVNSAANGFIYFFCNKQFRGDLMAHYRCRRNTQNEDVEMANMQ